MITVRLIHMRHAKYCPKGTKDFFNRHGLDWENFKRNGIDGQKLLDTNDIMAIKLVRIAESVENGWEK